jgi:hypothetical protein
VFKVTLQGVELQLQVTANLLNASATGGTVLSASHPARAKVKIIKKKIPIYSSILNKIT